MLEDGILIHEDLMLKFVLMQKQGKMVFNYMVSKGFTAERNVVVIDSFDCENWYKEKGISYSRRSIKIGIQCLIDAKFIKVKEGSKVKYLLNPKIIKEGLYEEQRS